MLSTRDEATVRSDSTLDDDEELVAVTGSLARFVRNLVADVPLNQEQALLVFPICAAPTPEFMLNPVKESRSSAKLSMISPHTDEARAVNV
jgi:hypothetical protein